MRYHRIIRLAPETMELYFIGYALSEEEKAPVDDLRERIAIKFGVQAALKTVPHITLVRPFETDKREMLVEGMRAIAAKEKPFVVPLANFSSFDKSRVWFVEPEQSQGLTDLHSDLRDLARGLWKREQIAPEFETRFHITLSYKDVMPKVHQNIGVMLRSESLPLASLNVTGVSLFKDRGAGQGWEVVETVPFGT